MIWSVAEQISRLSQAFELMPGDIIYSGTPENVGPVVRATVIEIHIDGLPEPEREDHLAHFAVALRRYTIRSTRSCASSIPA